MPTVVGDDRDVGVLGRGHHAAGAGAVDRVEHDHGRALVDRGVDLLGLLGLVLVGVVVGDLAVLAQVGHLGLEERLVEGLVAGGLRLRQQEGDGLTTIATLATVVGAFVGAARSGAEGEQRRQGDGTGAGEKCGHDGSPREVGAAARVSRSVNRHTVAVKS